jgi:hypothetical protein
MRDMPDISKELQIPAQRLAKRIIATIKRSAKWVFSKESTSVGIAGILVSYYLYSAIMAFRAGLSSVWLATFVQLITLFCTAIILTRNELPKYIWKLLLALVAIWIAGEFIVPRIDQFSNIAKNKIAINCDEQTVVINMSDLSESELNELGQITLAAQDCEKQWYCEFRVIPLREGQKVITHHFTADEIALLKKTDFLYLNFAKRYNLGVCFRCCEKCPAGDN